MSRWVQFSTEDALTRGLQHIEKPRNRGSNKLFRGTYGSEAKVVAYVWSFLGYLNRLPQKNTLNFEKLLFAFHHLKHYPTDEQGGVFTKLHQNTYSVWMRDFIFRIASLAPIIIKFHNRNRHATGEPYRTTVDGFDVHYFEDLTGRNPKKYSAKFNGPGLCWMVALSTANAEIVAIHGPELAGMKNDLQMFRESIKSKLDPGEKVLADRGYRGEACICTAYDFGISEEVQTRRKNLLARHETFHARINNWGCVSTSHPRHTDVSYHAAHIRAVIVITAIEQILGVWQPFSNVYTGPIPMNAQWNRNI